MGDAALKAEGDGRLVLSGVLDFASVPGIWEQLREQISPQKDLQVSLGEVTSANSAALVLLLEARHQAADQGANISFSQLPQGLSDLATLSNADDLIA